jgi:hypothetical protein
MTRWFFVNSAEILKIKIDSYKDHLSLMSLHRKIFRNIKEIRDNKDKRDKNFKSEFCFSKRYYERFSFVIHFERLQITFFIFRCPKHDRRSLRYISFPPAISSKNKWKFLTVQSIEYIKALEVFRLSFPCSDV